MTAPTLNSVAWFEIGSDRPDDVKKFFGDLFGWQFKLSTDLAGVDYHAAITPDTPGPSGGIFDHAGKFEDYAIFYVLVADVPAIIEQAKTLGGDVLMEPVTDAAGVTFARLRDNGGRHFGVFSMPAPIA
ncbi:VOC family protein [Microbacterium panaciterrae]|uniref:VOC family protein n=1 Tax=Microbacterium panaciterrae TaxID=985759 RepID=A0ABP8NXN8_9MICO